MNISHRYLAVEMVVIFLLLPSLIYFWSPHPLLPFLWILAMICGAILLKDKSFDRKTLWRYKPAISYQALFIQIILVSVFSVAIIYLIQPALLFSLIKTNALLWLLVIILYPLLSVYPQELIYRSFFFHRYRGLITNDKLMIVTNALLFGYMHIIFHNWVAVILTTLGGLYFASIYQRSHSILFVSIVHAIYGNLVFTLGLGEFFYHGSIATVAATFKF